MSSLQSEIDVLNAKLKEREAILEESEDDVEDSSLELRCQRYEDRIVELHSVIAELSRKLETTQDDVIREESEVEEDVVTDSCCDEIEEEEDEEDYNSVAFERDLDHHTNSLKSPSKPCCWRKKRR